MRFRYVLLLILSVILFRISDASAQKRSFATVDPNEGVFNETADLYDPLTGTITKVPGAMGVAREQTAAVRLRNGKILIAGGRNNRHLQYAELYDPASNSFIETGKMVRPRNGVASVLLENGMALIIGGYDSNAYLSTAELYEPVSGTFSLVSGTMKTPRQYPGVTRLDNDTILIVGGFNNAFISTAEIYDPVMRSFAETTGYMNSARLGHSVTLLAGGKALVAGGCNNAKVSEIVCDNYLSSAELFAPDTGKFSLTGSMNTARKDHTATPLANGQILIAGGSSGAHVLGSAEIYNPSTGVFTSTGSMLVPRVNHTASILPDGKVLIAGGRSESGQPLNSVEIYDPASGLFSVVNTPMTSPRMRHSAATLEDGKVLLIAGSNAPGLVFDINSQRLADNVGSDIYFSPDSQTGYAAYTGSGTILVFSSKGEELDRIVTGGYPAYITPIFDDEFLAVVSVLDNRIFIIDTKTRKKHAEYSFNGQFGFGSRLTVSPDGLTGYISSTGTGEVIKFDMATGKELGRIRNLRGPAQLTLTGDGRLLMVVDTIETIVVGVNTSNMTALYKFSPRQEYYPAIFSIFNKVVLNADESIALVTSHDAGATIMAAAMIFDPATGKWILDETGGDEGDDGLYGIGYKPGFSMLMPDGKYWLVLTQNYLSFVPTADPRNNVLDEDLKKVKNYDLVSGVPMESGNIALSRDARYAFYALATKDQVAQHDLQTGAVVGLYQVGDDPDISVDQPVTLALTPDGHTLVVMNFASNELELFTDSYISRQTKYISQQDRFTGLSIINVSDEPIDIKITAMTNEGGVYYTGSDTGLENPVTISLEANAQKSVDVSELFKLDNDMSTNMGYLVMESNKPVLVGYTAIGQIQSSFLSSHIRNMEHSLFVPSERILQDLIIPEIPEAEAAGTEISFVNPGYSKATYTVLHYSKDGTTLATQENNSLIASGRETTSVSGVVSTAEKQHVLIVGGFSATQIRSSGELFNGLSNTYSTSLSMMSARQGHSATALPTGKVLIVGGKDRFNILKTAELYDPAMYRFLNTPGSMNIERYRHTATRLFDGKVLLTGGQTLASITKTAELYDPSKGSFRYTAGFMSIPRDAHTATRLSNGKVLIAGGLDGVATSSVAELYDPATETFSKTGAMNAARAFHTAVLLQDGRVLIVGGYNGEYLDSAEIYDPSTGVFTVASAMTEARSRHTATMLSNGSVLITGGENSSTADTGGLNTAEVYNPTLRMFDKTPNNMSAYRSSHAAANLLNDETGSKDKVVVFGGFGKSTTADDDVEPGAIATTDVYDLSSELFTRLSSGMGVTRQGHTAILLESGVTTGYLRVKSKSGILASESYNLVKSGAKTAISGIEVAKYSGVKKIYSPRFVLSDNRTTLLNIINANEDNNADVVITLYSANGDVIAAKNFSFASNAQVKGNLTDIFQGTELGALNGWIEVSSSQDQIVGTMTFENSTHGYLASFELSPAPLTRFLFPLVSEDSDFETELSFLNSGTSAASVTLELWREDGTQAATRSVNLPPRTSLSGTLTEFFETSMTTGNVRVSSTQPVYGMGEMRARNQRFIVSVPPSAYPEN